VLYHHLKKYLYIKLVPVIVAIEATFEKYSEGKKAYRLSEFGIDRPECQEKLKELESENRGHVPDRIAYPFFVVNGRMPNL
jgi:hypothetical protein